MVVEERKLI